MWCVSSLGFVTVTGGSCVIDWHTRRYAFNNNLRVRDAQICPASQLYQIDWLSVSQLFYCGDLTVARLSYNYLTGSTLYLSNCCLTGSWVALSLPYQVVEVATPQVEIRDECPVL